MSGNVRGNPIAADAHLRSFTVSSRSCPGDTVISLSAIGVRNAQPRATPYKLADAGGLYLLVNPGASKLWRFDYSFDGRRKTLALGAFPEKGLADAREERDEAKRRLRAGADPSAERKGRRGSGATPVVDHRSLRSVATRWFAARKGAWVPSYSSRVWSRIEGDILPALGSRPVGEIQPEKLLAALRQIEARGAIEMARRVKSHLDDLFRYAKSEKLVPFNPCEDLADALATPAPPKRRAALKGRELPEFLRKLDNYDGDPRTKLAIHLTLLTFVRTNEVRFAAWEEFEDLDGKEPLWRIPAERMKMRDEHLVPLAPA